MFLSASGYFVFECFWVDFGVFLDFQLRYWVLGFRGDFWVISGISGLGVGFLGFGLGFIVAELGFVVLGWVLLLC